MTAYKVRVESVLMPDKPNDGLNAQKRYIAKNIVRVVVSLNRNTDADILEFLEGVENKQGYVKSLIRADIAARKS